MKTPTLHSMVKVTLYRFPNYTTEQVYSAIAEYFLANTNPRWLRNAIHSYRARLLKKMKEKE